MFYIAVPINFLGSTAETTSVNDAGMVQRIAQDEVVFTGEYRNNTRIGSIPRTKNKRGFSSFCLHKIGFQSRVEFAVPGDEARAACACAESACRLNSSGDHRWVCA